MVEVLRVEREAAELTAAKARLVPTRSTRWSVRVWKDGGAAGFGVGADRQTALGSALERAASAPADPHAGPADRMALPTGSLGVDDRRWSVMTDADRLEVLQPAERALSTGGSSLVSFRYEQAREVRSWLTSRGVEATEAATTWRLSAEAAFAGARASSTIVSRHFSDVASLPFGHDLRVRLEGLARATTAPPEPRPWVLEPRVSAELMRSIAPLFAGQAVAAGNPLQPYRGKRLSDILHVNDDAGLPSGVYTNAFDDRGVPSIPVPILKEGHVGSFYYDVEEARALGLRPTGHVRDGAVRPSNLVVRPGARTRNVILGELKHWVAPDRLPPFDLGTGRFVGSVPFARVDGGERVGTFHAPFDLGFAELLAAVREVAADQERDGEVDTPTWVLAPPK